MQVNVLPALMGAGLAFFASGAQTFTATPINSPLVIEGILTPAQMMRVVEGHPFTVPGGMSDLPGCEPR